MCAHVLDECAGNCSAHIGGLDLDYGNFRDGGKKYFVSEACEYKANFLALHPEVTVILNTDADHLESYGNESRLLAAYERVCGFGFRRDRLRGGQDRRKNSCGAYVRGRGRVRRRRRKPEIGERKVFFFIACTE